MKLIFFSHYYPPEVNAPASRTSENCRAWAKAGHDVTVVTCAPNHPTGKVYPGFRNRLWHSEIVDGVRVIRLWTFLAANKGTVLRTLNYVSYLMAVIVALLFLPRTDVFVSTSPQFFCGLAGMAAKVLRRRPWVFEVRDIWPESIVSVGAMEKSWAVRMLERIETLAYRKADHIVCTSRAAVAHIAERLGRADKISLVENGADLSLYRADTDGHAIRRELGLDGKIIAAYVGTHGMAHGLETLLSAAEILRGDSRIVFLCVGDGAERERLERIRQQKSLTNVMILGQRPKADMPAIWAATDISLILLKRNDLFRKVLPSKMFEAMAMRKPIVLGVEGEAMALLKEADAGIAIQPENAAELAKAIKTLADAPTEAERMGVNGERHVRAHYDRAVLAERYLGILLATHGAKARTS